MILVSAMERITTNCTMESSTTPDVSTRKTKVGKVTSLTHTQHHSGIDHQGFQMYRGIFVLYNRIYDTETSTLRTIVPYQSSGLVRVVRIYRITSNAYIRIID